MHAQHQPRQSEQLKKEHLGYVEEQMDLAALPGSAVHSPEDCTSEAYKLRVSRLNAIAESSPKLQLKVLPIESAAFTSVTIDRELWQTQGHSAAYHGNRLSWRSEKRWRWEDLFWL